MAPGVTPLEAVQTICCTIARRSPAGREGVGAAGERPPQPVRTTPTRKIELVTESDRMVMLPCPERIIAPGDG